MGEDGFEPPKVKTSRFTVCPIWPLWYSPVFSFLSGDFFIRLLIVSRSLPSGNSLLPRSPSSNSSGNKLRILFKRSEPMEGVEPTTPRLQITCSSQLSYIGVSRFFLPVQVFPKGIAKIGIYSLSPKLFSFLFRISRKNN